MIIATGCAANANKTVTEQATGKELSELALDEARHAALPRRSLGQKGFEVLLYYAIQKRIFGRAALIIDGGNLSRDREGEELSSRANRMPCAREIWRVLMPVRLVWGIDCELRESA